MSPYIRSADPHVTRRTAIQTAGVAALAVSGLAACGSETAPSAGTGGGAPSSSAPASGSSAGLTAKVADIPVGGGKIFADQDVVVTQPTSGEFKAFSATCTHQGCKVKSVTDGQIVCPCHNSKFAVADGSVISGPAKRPLPAKTISVDGDSIVLA